MHRPWLLAILAGFFLFNENLLENLPVLSPSFENVIEHFFGFYRAPRTSSNSDKYAVSPAPIT
jgi:hypothetical protein